MNHSAEPITRQDTNGDTRMLAELEALVDSAYVQPKRPLSVSAAPSLPESPSLVDRLNKTRSYIRRLGLPDNQLAVLDALIDLAILHNRLDQLIASLASLSSRTNIPASTISRVLIALETQGYIVKEREGDKIIKANQYALLPDLLTPLKWEDVIFWEYSPSHFNGVSGGYYTAHRADDIYATGTGGSRSIAKALGNAKQSARKLGCLLIDLVSSTEMTVEQMAAATGRSADAVGRTAKRNHELGLMERRQECAPKAGRRFWYSVPANVDQRAAMAVLDTKTFGVGMVRAEDGAWGIHHHATRLLHPSDEPINLGNPQESKRPVKLTEAQRAILKAWNELALIEYTALLTFREQASRLDKTALRSNIRKATSEEMNKRFIRAAREFVAALPEIKIATMPDAKLSLATAKRLFPRWASVNGYTDLTVNTAGAHLRLELALKQAYFTSKQTARRSEVLAVDKSPRWPVAPQYQQVEMGVNHAHA